MTTLHELTVIQAPVERVFSLALSVDVHLLGSAESGEQVVRTGGKSTGIMGPGDEVTWRARHFGVTQNLTSRITRYDAPHAFQDTMQRGAFKWMQHDHFFLATPQGQTAMRDVFRFAAPLGVLGLLAEKLILARYMQTFLRQRNAVLKRVAESDDWGRYLQ